jgi:hypothetical protein
VSCRGRVLRMLLHMLNAGDERRGRDRRVESFSRGQVADSQRNAILVT